MPVLAGLFAQVLRLGRELGVMKVGRVALDGSKVQAKAAKPQALSWARRPEPEKAMGKQVKELFARAEAADAEEDRRMRKRIGGRGRIGEGMGCRKSGRGGRRGGRGFGKRSKR